jgi:hypothetical protein
MQYAEAERPEGEGGPGDEGAGVAAARDAAPPSERVTRRWNRAAQAAQRRRRRREERSDELGGADNTAAPAFEPPELSA